MQIYFISYKKPPTSQPGFATKKKGGGRQLSERPRLPAESDQRPPARLINLVTLYNVLGGWIEQRLGIFIGSKRNHLIRHKLGQFWGHHTQLPLDM